MHCFFVVYSGLKSLPSLPDINNIPFHPRNFRNSILFTATCKPSAGCASAANHLCKHVGIFRKPITSLTQILRSFVAFLYQLTCVFFFPEFRALDLILLLYGCFQPCCFCLFSVVLCVCVYLYLFLSFVSVCWLYNKHLCC
jgi:hypothetical protein